MKANVHTNGIQNLNIDLGEIRLAVNGDESKVLAFNPDDVDFTERFYSLIGKVDEVQKRYEAIAAELDADSETDAYGIKKNQPEIFKMQRDVCAELRAEIDDVFGAGVSDMCFGSTNTLEMFGTFFTAITPFVEKSRASKIQKYTKSSGKAVKK